MSGQRGIEENYDWPSNKCRSKKEPNLFVNVGSYAKELWDIIKEDAGDDCQETVEI